LYVLYAETGKGTNGREDWMRRRTGDWWPRPLGVSREGDGNKKGNVMSDEWIRYDTTRDETRWDGNPETRVDRSII
jgi:hypothetical protein